jgi:uncharacterized protein involved in copper resistance
MEVRNFSIIVLAQRLVSERVRKGSLYTPRGKEKALGSLPSVKTRAREQISREGAPHLGFGREKSEVDGLDECWDEERV